MAASALGVDGTPVLESECTFKILERGEGQRGTLYLTSKNKLVLVLSSGLLSKTYRKSHSIDASNILNVRIEGKALGLGKCLVVEWSYEGSPLTYRYDYIANPHEWTNRISEIMKTAKQTNQAYDGIIRLIRAQEVTSFDQIEGCLCAVWPDFANKTKEEKSKEIVDFLSTCIDQQLVEGFVDSSNRQFTHLVAYKQRIPQKEKEIIKEVVMIPCVYCGGLMPNTSLFCPKCGAQRKA